MNDIQRMLRAGAAFVTREAARAYVAGPELEDALRTVREVAGRSQAASVGYWNPRGEAPRRIADACLEALDRLGEGPLDCRLSVKVAPMGCDPALFGEVLEQGRRTGRAVHIDAMAPEAADATLDLVRRSVACHPGLGFTLPARWTRSLGDADVAISLGAWVRVVKGQWPDPEADVDSRRGYLALVERLAGPAAHVAVATHDEALARESLGILLDRATPCELELLYGWPMRRMLRLAQEFRVPVRLYVPYGQAALPYGLGEARRDLRIAARALGDAARAAMRSIVRA